MKTSRKLLSAVHADLARALEKEGASEQVGKDELESLSLPADSTARQFLNRIRDRMSGPKEGACTKEAPGMEAESCLVGLIGRRQKKGAHKTSSTMDASSEIAALGPPAFALHGGAASDPSLRMYVEGPTSEKELRGHRGPVYSVAFSPNGEKLASASFDDTARVWNASSGVAIGAPLLHDMPVTCVAFSHDGMLLASGSWSGKILMHRASTRSEAACLSGHGGDFVRSLVFDPKVGAGDPRLISAGNDNCIREWNFGLREQLGGNFTGHSGGGIHALGLSPDSSKIVSGGADKTVRIWDRLAQTQIGAPIQLDADVESLSIHPKSGAIAVVAGMTLSIFSLETREPLLKNLPLGRDGTGIRKACSIAHSPDGNVLAITVGSTVELRHAGSGELLREPIQDAETSECLNSVAWSPDGRSLATASQSKLIRVYRFGGNDA